MLILASASPRRAELLTAAAIAFEVASAGVDETPQAGEAAAAYVRRLAEAKARAVSGRVPGALVLGADTVVVIDGTILGKPASRADAIDMLRKLSGRTHEVLTGVALISPRCTDVRVAVTQVVLAALSDHEIRRYVAGGEPMDKAGAYAIQGHASRFVERIDGSYSNVVGLPVALVYGMMVEAGAMSL
ncbi:MAG: nucleoside triphosphate pyrophosphatase [Vicinamibacterales bacterium]